MIGDQKYGYLGIMCLILVFLTSCETPKIPVPIGGSKSDGVVDLSYQVGMFETPVVDWGPARHSAENRCRAWGYSSAHAFGGQRTHCQAFNGYGDCVLATVIISYQCVE